MARHGELTSYTHHGCRCDLCKATMSAYNKEYRRKRIEAGLCTKCGTPVTEGETACFECKVRDAEARRRYRERVAERGR